jgi:single-strand DNA-binding protein
LAFLAEFLAMNSCVLMAEIISEPQLRFTQEAQLAVTEMIVQFPALRAEETAGTVKVIGWGNLAEQMQSQFHQGDRVVIEGRLGMNSIDRPEGFKEKRAELTASRIHILGADTPMTAPVATATTNPPATASPAAAPTAAVSAPAPEPVPVVQPDPEPVAAAAPAAKAAAKTKAAAAAPLPEPNYDDIPF